MGIHIAGVFVENHHLRIRDDVSHDGELLLLALEDILHAFDSIMSYYPPSMVWLNVSAQAKTEITIMAMPIPMTGLALFPLTPSSIILISKDGMTICFTEAITTKMIVAMSCLLFSLILEKI